MADERTSKGPDVSGLIGSAFMFGIGAAEMTRDRMTEFTNDLIERGKMSESDAKKVAESITEATEHQQELISKTVADSTSAALKTTGVVTRKDFDELRSELDEIKALLLAQAGSKEEEPAS